MTLAAARLIIAKSASSVEVPFFVQSEMEDLIHWLAISSNLQASLAVTSTDPQDSTSWHLSSAPQCISKSSHQCSNLSSCLRVTCLKLGYP